MTKGQEMEASLRKGNPKGTNRFNYLKYNESPEPIGAGNTWKEEIKSI